MKRTALLLLALPALAEETTWRGLQVAPESRCSSYERSDYRYSPAIEKAVEARDGLVSRYTGRTFAGTHETDVDHVVATSEAHDSGLCGRPAARRGFARVLENLALADPALNRWQKRGKDAGEWLPARPARCWFAVTVLRVKRKWRLSVDVAERDALEEALATCPCTCKELE